MFSSNVYCMFKQTGPFLCETAESSSAMLKWMFVPAAYEEEEEWLNVKPSLALKT